MSIVKLRSSDGQLFEVDDRLAAESETIKPRLEDYDGDPIPIPNVTGRVLALVIEYLQKELGIGDAGTVADGGADRRWDNAYVCSMGCETIFDLILAANYLEIKGLLDLACDVVAWMIRGRSSDEIRRIFNLSNEFTPEEEEEIRRENQWAFE